MANNQKFMMTPKYFLNLKNSRIFATLVNVKNFIRHRSMRVKWSKVHNHFVVKSETSSICASVNSRVLSYNNGFEYRSRYLRDVYFIHEVELSPSDLVIDCGANMGDFSRALREVCSDIEYIGIEPNPNDFAALKHNNPNDVVLNMGLWNQDGQIDFYVNDKSASSSFIEPPEFREILQIQCSRADSLFTGRAIKLFKLEAEGAEPEVLQGLEGILPSIKYITADVGPERGKLEESTYNECVEFLLARNFKILVQRITGRNVVLFKNQNWLHESPQT